MGGKARPAVAATTARSNRILVGVVVFYVIVLGVMVALDRYLFFVKTLIVPVLLLAALLSRRLKAFVNDWALFLAAVIFFEFGRGLAFALTTHFELPMYLGYVVAAERWLCGGGIAPIFLQQLRAGLADPAWLDRFFVLVYSSHFLFFLLFGFGLWYTRRELFRPYAIAIVALLYAGLVVYFAVPTIPPWAAASEFLVLPPVVQIVRAFYTTRLPQLVTVFDTNPIAAMPSLHAALPTMCALFALRYLGRPGLLVLFYTIAVWLAVVYLGEHYAVDVIAGIASAVLVFGAVQWWETRRRSAARPPDPQTDDWAIRLIAVALVLVAAAVGFGQLSARWAGPVPITRHFIDRELKGRSVLAHYYLGRVAFTEGDFATAETELTAALNDMTRPADQKIVRSFLAQSATQLGDFPAVINALEPLRASTDASNLVLLGNAYVEREQYETGLAVLRDARRRFPGDPESLYWLTRHQYLHGQVDRSYVGHAIELLGRFPSSRSDPLRLSLTQMLEGGQPAPAPLARSD